MVNGYVLNVKGGVGFGLIILLQPRLPERGCRNNPVIVEFYDQSASRTLSVMLRINTEIITGIALIFLATLFMSGSLLF